MEIQGLDNFNKTLENANKNFNKEAGKSLDKITQKLIAKVKSKTPIGKIKGGTLRRSWQPKKSGELERIVYNNVKYAPHVEFGHRTRLGTSKNPKYKPKKGAKKMVDGRYMLTKSVEEIKSELDKEFSIMIDNLWK